MHGPSPSDPLPTSVSNDNSDPLTETEKRQRRGEPRGAAVRYARLPRSAQLKWPPWTLPVLLALGGGGAVVALAVFGNAAFLIYFCAAAVVTALCVWG